VADSRVPLQLVADESLGEALRELGRAVDFPPITAPAGSDIAARARLRIVSSGIERRPRSVTWLGRLGRRPLRRSLVLAVAALLVLAAVVGAISYWLPGIRIIFGEGPPPSATASPSGQIGGPLGPIGEDLGLGTNVTIEEAERSAGFDVILPVDPVIGPPDAVYLDREIVSLVWAPKPGLTAASNGVGLLINEFRGSVTEDYYQKVLGADSTVARVSVDGSTGFFISGPPHYFFYIDENGNDVDASRRVVGDALLWSSGELTFRLESNLGVDEAIRLAESLE
jgi:hypothetical protein